MAVTFVLGRPASKREDYIVEQIAALVGQNPLAPVLVIVPPQATYATECMLLDRLKQNGMMGLGVMSISRVAQRVLEEVYGGARQTLGAAGKSMIIHRILKEHAAQMKLLSRMRARYLLPPQLADIITEMKQLDVTPDMLRDFPAPNSNTKSKFEDIAFLMDIFQSETEGLYDTEDRLEMVIEHIHEADFLRGAHVVIHGFDMYNAQTVRFITEVMKTAKHTTLSFLYADGKEADSEVYGICNENRMRFYDVAQALGLDTKKITQDMDKSPDILHIEKNIYAFPAKKAGRAKDVSVSHAKSMREEVDGVAAQIAYLTQKRRYRFDEVAVVCGRAEDYLPLIEERFAHANIPCYTGKKRTLLQSGLADFVLSGVELCRGRLKKDTLLAHASTGYCALSKQQQSVLKNYAFSNIRDGFAFLKQFDGEAEQARLALMEPIEALRKNAAKAKNARQLLDCVRRYMEQLGVEQTVKDDMEEMREKGWYEEADFTAQAWDRLHKLMEQAADVLGGEVSGGRMARVLKAGMMAEQISVIPPGADEVLCADIAGTWLPDIRALFVLGANEGSIPSYAGKADILTEEERELILGGIKGLKHTGSIDKQRLAVVKAFSRPSEKLLVSYVKDGKAQPSLLLDRLHALFDGIRVNDMADIAPMLAQNAWEQGVRCMRSAADGSAEECSGALSAVLQEDAYAQKLERMAQQMKQENRAADIGRYAQSLYGEFAASATRIEQFYACPYRHFLRYGVKVQNPQEYMIDSLDVGRYAHQVLDGLTGSIKQAGKGWSELTEQEFDGFIEQSLAQAKGHHARYGMNRHNESVIASVSGEVRAVAQAIRRQCSEGLLQPHLQEQQFDLAGMDVRGIVDRIDIAEWNGQKYFGIVDYKTGKKEFELSRVAGGIDLQLFIYILAAQMLLGEDYMLAGANYMRVYDALRERGEALMPLYRMRGVESASADAAAALYGKEEGGALYAVNAKLKADGTYDKRSAERYLPPNELETALSYCKMLITDAKRRIGQGENAVVPAEYRKTERACKYCEYGVICMFDEAASSVREIEKLPKEALIEKMDGELGERA